MKSNTSASNHLLVEARDKTLRIVWQNCHSELQKFDGLKINPRNVTCMHFSCSVVIGRVGE